jgi:hypothetical protein
MPMHPNPMADTSRLLFPSFRFCTVSPRWGGPRGLTRVYPPYSNVAGISSDRFPDPADILPDPVRISDFM